jgi:hypothetical protein
MNTQELVLQLVAKFPDARNDEIAAMVRKQRPGAKTTGASVSSIKTRAKFSGSAQRRTPATRMGHFVPGGAVRATFASKGIDSVNTATEWAAVHGIVPARIIAIVRGRREGLARERMDGTRYFDPPGVAFKDADEIALALGMPELWSTDWAEWALPVDVERLIRNDELSHEELFSRDDPRPAAPGDRVVHATGRFGTVDQYVGLALQVSFDDGRVLVIPARKLRLLTT